MKKYLMKRLLYLLFVLFCVTVFSFGVTTLAPGNPADMGVGRNAPFLLRYIAWLRIILIGPPSGVIWPYSATLSTFAQLLPGTLRLISASLFAIVIVSIPLGMLSAIKKNSAFDYFIRFISFFGISIPNFAIGFFLLYTFAVALSWFPVIGDGGMRNMVLPVCALSIPLVSRNTRQIRGVVLEELNQEYITGATARGVRRWRIVCFHILPNTIPSMFGFLNVLIGHLLGGAVIIETVFIWKGIGTLATNAIRNLNYPVIQSYVLWMAILYICSSFILDVVYHLTDPQFRRRRTG